MPLFATGNSTWDQGLNGLAGSLFPDPSNQAKAGYYGAETGKTIIEAGRLRDQDAARAQLSGIFTPGGQTPVLPPVAGQGPPVAQAGQPPPAGAPPAPPPVAGQPPAAAPPPPSAVAAPGGPPAPVMPPPGPAPGVGTDGKPMPPDPSLQGPAGMHVGMFNPPGGGVKNSPPAAQNGQPAPMMMTLPQIIALGTRAGYDPNLVMSLARSYVNMKIQDGELDANTGARFLSGAGDPVPLQSQTTLQNTALSGQYQIANTKQAGQNALQLQGAGTVQTVGPDGKPVYTTQGQATTQGMPAYDPQRALQADKPTVVVGPDGKPVITTAGQAPGQTPYDETQAHTDAQLVTIITPTGQRQTVTVGQLRANPGLGTAAVPSDLAGTNVVVPGQASPRVVPNSVAMAAPPGAPAPTVLPQGMDQQNAYTSAIIGSLNQNDPSQIPGVVSGAQAGITATTPKTTLPVPEEQRIELMLDDAVTKLYPAPSGWHPLTSDKSAALPGPTRAYAIKRISDLMMSNPQYRANPAAAVTAVLQEMQGTDKTLGGILPKEADRSTNVFGSGANVGTSGAGKTAQQHIFIQPLRDLPGSLSETVAPTPTPTTTPTPTPTPAPMPLAGPRRLPPGAIGVVPQGIPDGATARKNGVSAVARGGFFYPTGGSASQ